jgi:DHA1 family multidrug/chloramphenicol efflux transport protein-like MFS transporter
MPQPLIAISRKQALIFAFFLVLYEFLTYTANDMIMPGMIQVVNLFHAPESMVASSLTAYILGGASLQLILGPLSDAYGRRPLMLIGALLFCFFTFLIAYSNSMDHFLIARFFQGMGLCFISVIGYATIQELFDEMDAIRLIAVMASAAILAPLLGPLFGAIIIHYTSWRVIFFIIGLCALVTLWGLWRYMPEPIGQTTTKGTLIARVPFSPHYIVAHYKALLSNKTFCFSTLAIGLLGIPCFAWIALAPIILITEGNLTAIEYGLWQLPVFGVSIIANGMLHWLTYKYSIKTIMCYGSIILAIGTLLMALIPYIYGNNYYYLLPGTIIYFFGLTIMSAPLNRYCLYITTVSKGTASALISLSVMGIGAIGIEIVKRCYEHHNNFYFGLFNMAVIILFLVLIGLALWSDKNPESTIVL